MCGSKSSRWTAVLAAMLLAPALSAPVVSAFASPGPPSKPAWMTGTEIKTTFGGKTIQGHYASGTAFIETYHAEGGIDYVERTRQFIGHWSLQGDAFCTIYRADGSGGCYRVTQVGENCYEFYFVARTEYDAANALTIPPSWTARAAVSDRSGTCDERPAV